MNDKVFNSTELINQAFALHSANKLDEAEKIYQLLLENNSVDSNLLNLYGLLCIAKCNYSKAIELLSKALIINSNAYIMTNLAKAYYMNSDYEKSILFYNQAADIEPTVDIYYSMAIAYKKLERFDEAINAYKKALDIDSNNYNVLYNLANLHKELGQIDISLSVASKAEFINPNDEDIQTLLATIYELKQDYSKAVVCLEKAAKLSNNYLYFYNLGVLYSRIKNFDKSIENYRKVLLLQPKHVETLVNLSSVYREIDKNESLSLLREAYEISPDETNVCLSLAQIYKDLFDNKKSLEVLYQLLSRVQSAEAHSLIAINYMDLLNYSEALKEYNIALALEPSNLNFLHGKAMALKYLGMFDEAKLLLEYIVSKDKKSIQSETTLGMMCLQQKDFHRGMELYIQRSKETKFYNIFKDRIWKKGCSFKDKSVLIYSDCGLGDTIMFSRYIPALLSVAKRVILQTDSELVQIIKNSFSGVDVVSKTEKIDEYDIVIPIMNLAYALDIDFDNIPYSEGYLKAEKKELSSEKLKIGICYQGNKRVFKNRSIPYSVISRLSTIQNIQLYSFQLENSENECDNIINLSSQISNYNDTAGLLQSLDILVTIDSSIAHMAGALGVKTYLLLPYTAEWRWFNDYEITPWYDSIKIFKQKSPACWDDVIDKVKTELVNYANK